MMNRMEWDTTNITMEINMFNGNTNYKQTINGHFHYLFGITRESTIVHSFKGTH